MINIHCKQELNKIRNMKDFINGVAKIYSDKTAFVFSNKGIDESISYREFLNDINFLGTALFAKNIKNKRIAILCENSYEWIVTYFASTLGSNVIIPLERNCNKSDLELYLKDSGAEILFYSNNFLTLIEKECKYNNKIISICIDEIHDFISQGEVLLSQGYKSFINHISDETKLCEIIYTSGTTGEPKGVMLSQANIIADVIGAVSNVDAKGTVVQILPFHHMFSLITLMAEMYHGMQIYISSNLASYFYEIQKVQPELLIVVPAFIEFFAKKIKTYLKEENVLNCNNYNCSLYEFISSMNANQKIYISKRIKEMLGGRLKTIICGGAYLEPAYVDLFSLFGVQVLVGYGLTECVSIVSVNKNNAWNKESVGLKIPTCDFKIISPDTDGIGEIVIKGETVMLGYNNSIEDSKNMFTDDGWLKTGDLGKIDEAGFLYITGRKKNLIILSNGENVSAEEIEHFVYKIPHVKEVVAFQKDNMICVEIYPDELENIEEMMKEEIIRLNHKLPIYKNISRIYIRNKEFPKTSTQKIKRSCLDLQKEVLTNNKSENETNTEHKEYIKSIWAEILDLPESSIPINVSFFELGGDSISAYLMFERINKINKGQIPIDKLMPCRTIEDICRCIQKDSDIEQNSQTNQEYFLKRDKKIDVAITGLNFILPKATNSSEYWKLLCEAKCMFSKTSKKRKQLFHNENWEDWICEINNIDEFDYEFFGLSKEEASFIDPHQRLIMEVAYNALADAGEINNDKTRKKTGVFVSSNAPSYQNVIKDYVDIKGIDAICSSTIAGNLSSEIPARIAHMYNFVGCAISVDTACSSFLTALHLAKEKIRNLELTGAVIIASNIISEPLIYRLLEKEGLLSKNGKMNLFDIEGSGMIPGEGIVAIYIESTESAKKMKKHIYGVVRGTAINHNGTSLSLMAANPQSQLDVMKKAFKDAQLEPYNVSYVEAAGTGIHIGDQIEFSAHRKCFENVELNSVALGCVKTHIGNLMYASSAASLVKILLCIKNKKITPSFNIDDNISNKLDTTGTPFYFTNEVSDWKCMENGKRIAAIFSSGLGGSNAYALIEEWDEKESTDESFPQLIVVSAKRKEDLDKMVKKTEEIVVKQSSSNLADICFTLSCYRPNYLYRAASIITKKGGELAWKYNLDTLKNASKVMLLVNRQINADSAINSDLLKIISKHLNTICDEVEIKDLCDDKFAKEISDSNDEVILTYGICKDINSTSSKVINLESIISDCTDEKQIMLQITLYLYLCGVNINWSIIFNNENLQVVSLPSYQFKKEKVWLDSNELEGEKNE